MTSTTLALPGQEIIGLIPAGQLAEQGIAQSVPIVAARWFDDRQTCKLVHDYLDGQIEGRFEEYRACKRYAAGVCACTGGAGLLCLFHEPDRSLAWGLARQWQRVALPDGSSALQKRPPA
jgi:hypothetical protein